MGILPLRPDGRRLVQTAGNGVLGNLPMLDRGRRGRGHGTYRKESLKHRWGENWSRFSSSGQGSVHTTERYLGCKQKIRRAVNDAIALEDA